MFRKNRTENLTISNETFKISEIEQLLSESERLLKLSTEGNLSTSLTANRNSIPIVCKIIDNLNMTFKNYKMAIDYNEAKYSVSAALTKAGTWESNISDGNSVNQNHVIIWSKEFRSMLGFSSESEFPNKLISWSERLHPDDKQEALNGFNKLITNSTGRVSYNCAYRLKMKNGEYHYFQATASALDKEGSMCIIGMVKDVQQEYQQKEDLQQFVGYNELLSALKNTQDEIERSEKNDIFVNESRLSNISADLKKIASTVNLTLSNLYEKNKYLELRLNSILEGSNIATWDMKIQGGDLTNPNNSLTWSDDFRHLLGYKNEEDFPNILNSLSKCVHPDDNEQATAGFIAHVMDYTGRTPYSEIFRARKKTGEYIYMHLFGSTLRDSQGNPIWIAGAGKDITAEHEEKVGLQTARLRLDLLLKSTNLALWDMTVNNPNDPTDTSNQFWWSDEFRHLLGYKNEVDFPNALDNWAAIVHPEDVLRVVTELCSHFADKTGNTPFNTEYRIKKKSGEYIIVSADCSTLRDENGIPYRTIGSSEDITNQLRKSDLEKQINKVNKFSESISDMSKSIADILDSTHRLSKAQETNLNSSILAEKNASEIKSIIVSIKDMASQTSMLGINASIEAARSGEAGKGFKVVADEIGILAERSKASANLIEAKLKTIQDSANIMTSDIKDTSLIVDEQVSLIPKVKEILDEINNMYTELIDIIKSKT